MLRLFMLCACCFVTQSVWAGSLSWVSQDRWVTVNRIIDGDTFNTRKGEKIRLLGINTPEIQHDSSPAQPLGKEASSALKTLIAGQQVRLSFDKEKKDKYGRTLAHVYLRNGLWVNGELVRQGFAHVYTFVPNIREAQKLVKIEQEAIAEKRNMWGHKRWKVLEVKQLKTSLLGQFRLVHGVVTKVAGNGWRFELGKLTVTVPKKYRKGFTRGYKVQRGELVLLRGRLRMSKKKQWFLSVHTESDIAHIK